MKRRTGYSITIVGTVILLVLIYLFFSAAPKAADGENTSVQLTGRIRLENITGRIDHLTLDAHHDLLYVSALGHDSIEIINLSSGKDMRSISGFSSPQGVFAVSAANRLYVANAGTGDVNVVDMQNFSIINTLPFAQDADNMRYDSDLVYVGYGSGGIGIINASTGMSIRNFTFTAHPEGFVVSQDTIYVNTPEHNSITLINKNTGALTEWTIDRATGNFPMDIDRPDQRLFIATRFPSRLLVYNIDTASVVDTIEIDGDPDDLFYDAQRRQIYVICGSGFIDVIKQMTPDTYFLKSRAPTAPAARTGLFVSDTIYVAVPQSNTQQAQIEKFLIK